MGTKLAEIEQQREPVTLAMVGSSRTKFHIIPEVLDSTLAAQGWPSRSYNYGLLGTPATEISYVVDHLLRADLPALETIVIELQPLPLHELHWHPLSRKGAYHFDTRRVALGLEAAHEASLTGEERRAAYARFLRLGLRHYLMAGQGTNLVRSLSRSRKPRGQEDSLRGFTPLTLSPDDFQEHLTRLRERKASVIDSLSVRSRIPPTPLDTVLARHFTELAARASAADIQTLFIVQPMTRSVEGVADLLTSGGRPVIRLNDPARYPHLYEESLWYDKSHYNVDGARRVTQTAAREMAQATSRAN